MKILFVDLKYDYGIKSRGLNLSEIAFKKPFELLGHEVQCFYYDEYLDKKKQLQVELLSAAESFQPDLIYFLLFQDQFEIETLDRLKEKSLTVNWFGDDQWRFENFTAHYAPHFTWNVTTDPFSLSKYKKIGVKNVFLSQWAALDIEKISEATTTPYKFDISFIGGAHSTRKWFVKELKSRGINVATFGHDWPTGSVSLEKMVEIFQTSRINLNLGNSIIGVDLRFLVSSFKAPLQYMRSSKTASQIKARNFEIPYYGGFQLTEYVPKLDLYFNIGSEVACFSNVDEAALMIRYYLENEAEREKIKAAGTLRARNEHGFLSRHRKFFAHIEGPRGL